MSQCQGHAKQQEFDLLIRTALPIGDVQELHKYAAKKEAEIKSLKEQLENCRILMARIENERNACLEELHAISEALGTSEGHSSVINQLEKERDDAITISQITAVTHERMVDLEAQVVKLTNDLDAALKTDQEPVAIGRNHNGRYISIGLKDLIENQPEHIRHEWSAKGEYLYTHPAPVVSSEPVAWMNPELDASDEAFMWGCEWQDEGWTVPLYIHPARTLSDEEILAIANSFGSSGVDEVWLLNVVRAVLEASK